jgi:hypothetical protein
MGSDQFSPEFAVLSESDMTYMIDMTSMTRMTSMTYLTFMT